MSLDGLEVRTQEIEATAQRVAEGEVAAQPAPDRSDSSYTVSRFATEELGGNLFAPFAVKSHELFKLWYEMRSNDNFVKLSELDTGLIRGIGSHDWQEGLFNNPIAKLRNKDIWIVKQVNEKSITARHRFVEDTVEIPNDSVVNDFHRYAGRSQLDATDLDEFALVEDPGTGRFFELSETEGIPERWRGSVSNNLPKRLSHIAFMRRPDLTASGTRHLAYYTGERRLFHGMWVIPKLNPDQAKQFAVWFDSSLNLLQML